MLILKVARKLEIMVVWFLVFPFSEVDRKLSIGLGRRLDKNQERQLAFGILREGQGSPVESLERHSRQDLPHRGRAMINHVVTHRFTFILDVIRL